jgi:transposase
VVIWIEFNDEDKAALNYERYNHPHPFVQQKMEVLWLKSQGLPHKEICRLACICSTTLTSYVREYQEGGIEALKTLPFRRPRSDLEDHRATLEAYFREHPPVNATEAMAEIERLTGLKRSPERVRVFMKKMGMKCRKVGMIPAKADIKVQETFKKRAGTAA